MNVSEQIDNFIRLNGNERDALNIALARLDRAESRVATLEAELPNVDDLLSENTALREKLEQAQLVLAEYSA